MGDDLYDGFGDDEEKKDSFFGGMRSKYAPPSSLGRGPPGTQMGSRLMTSSQQQATEARPMTSVNGAGYSSSDGAPQSRGGFDPLNQGNRGPAMALQEKTENSPEERAKEMEKQVNRLLEQSAEACARRQPAVALEKAKEAGKKERALCKYREQNGLAEQINQELTYSTCFNLANCFALNDMHADAINTYSLIVKNKQYPQSGRLRVNMGNIYFGQKDYMKAVRMYRMALDQIPNTGKEMRFKIMRNIGNALVRMGQFQEAVQNFEAVMSGNPDFQSGFNLIVCHYALGDAEQMKKSFSRLLDIQVIGKTEEHDEDDTGGEHKASESQDMGNTGLQHASDNSELSSPKQEDEEEKRDKENKQAEEEEAAADAKKKSSLDLLKEELRERERKARTFVMNAAKLIAPSIDKDWEAGYDWVIEALRDTQFAPVASEMEIAKAMAYLKKKEFEKAIEVLKAFEKKDANLKARAATNLSFLYFVEGDLASSNKYANLAVRNDRYNAKALVNKGNCLFAKQQLERAREMYLEAIGVEADCSEAIFNLGLCNKRMGNLDEALQAFEKLHTIVPNSPEVIYQIAVLHDLLGNSRGAHKWFNILVTRIPTDPHVLSRMGQLFSKGEDETQALHYHQEAYRYYPVNLDVISWLGVWYVKSELYEKAIEFFQRAAQIQPHEVKWRLMVTSCYRRMSNYQKALELYEEIHRDYPDNVECLRYLVALCKDMGLPYDQYQNHLARLERAVQPTTNKGMLTQAAPAQLAAQEQRFAKQQQQQLVQQQSKQPHNSVDDEDERKLDVLQDKPSRKIDHSIGDRGPVIKGKKSEKEEEDEWAEADLDDLLAE